MLPWSFVCVLVLLMLDPSAAQTSSPADLEARILSSILEKSRYDSRVRPEGTNTTAGPVQVDVDIFVISLRDVSFLTMDFTAQLYLRTRWRDSRLRYDEQQGKVKYLSLSDSSKVWKPDLFFTNEKQSYSHVLLLPNVFLRINPTGDVLYSIRLTLKLACAMDFSRFPFDTQACSFSLASYSHSTDVLVFKWKKDNPLQVTEDAYLLEYTLTETTTGYCTSRTNTGESFFLYYYSCLRGEFLLQRHLRRYDILVFIPCCMFVIVSWVALWLDNKSTLIRVLVPLLDLVALSGLVRKLSESDVPKTNYTMPIDTWTGICLTFVFAVLVEVAVVDYVVRRSRSQHATASSQPAEDGISGVQPLELEEEKYVGKARGTSGGNKPSLKQRVETWLKRPISTADKIDLVFRILFPVLFGFFLMIYFGIHLTG
ncbi:unnamed protein product [Ixodes hexagonus]